MLLSHSIGILHPQLNDITCLNGEESYIPISLKVSQDLQFLDDLDVVKFSIGQDGDHLKQINKRSKLCNFFHWVIHLITFTHVPQNRELDRITSHILKEIQDELKEATDEERNLAERAIRNLRIVMKNNGGSQDDAIEQMLSTLAKIQSLPAVQNLSGKGNGQEDELLEEEIFDDSLEAEVHTDTKENQSEDPAGIKESKSDIPSGTKEIQLEVSPNTEATRSEALPITLNPKETKLQDLLQDLFNQKTSDFKVAESIGALLPELEGSVPLSDDLLAVLAKAFESIRREFLRENLSPGLLTCIVKNSLENGNLICLLPILKAMRFEAFAFEKEQFIAFAYGFELYRDALEADKSKEIPSNQMEKLIDSFYLYPKLIASFKNNLSEGEMKDFVQDFFELVVAQTTDDSQENIENLKKIVNFKTAIYLKNNFEDHGQIALETLCQVKSVKLLTQICSSEKASDFVLETILKANPPQEDDPDDSFFQEFVEESMKEIEKLRKAIADDPTISFAKTMNEAQLKEEEKHVNKIAEYVFANECAERQEILANKLSPSVLTLQLEHIPAQVWKNINDSILLEMSKKLIYQKPAPTNSALQALAKGLNADRLYDLISQDKDSRNFWGSLLLLCSFPTQVQFVSKALDSGSYEHGRCLEKIQSQLDPKVWEEASKQNPSRNYRDVSDYSPEILAHIVNGQINNQKFLRDFFQDYFDKHRGDLEKRKACVAHLKPEVFEFDKPEDFQHSTWYNLFKALREISDQIHAQSLLISSTLHLFNSPGFRWLHRECIYTLTREQLELLPIQQYQKPEIRLLLACLTNRLDDKLLDTANSLYDQDGGNFFDFFELAYSKSNNTPDILKSVYYFVFKKDIQLLKDFLLWVLDRPSMMPALPTWTWINEHYQGQEILASSEIQKDNDIQGHIKRLNLSVNKPKRGSGW